MLKKYYIEKSLNSMSSGDIVKLHNYIDESVKIYNPIMEEVSDNDILNMYGGSAINILLYSGARNEELYNSKWCYIEDHDIVCFLDEPHLLSHTLEDIIGFDAEDLACQWIKDNKVSFDNRLSIKKLA